jgi:hypothetical protein
MTRRISKISDDLHGVVVPVAVADAIGDYDADASRFVLEKTHGHVGAVLVLRVTSRQAEWFALRLTHALARIPEDDAVRAAVVRLINRLGDPARSGKRLRGYVVQLPTPPPKVVRTTHGFKQLPSRG